MPNISASTFDHWNTCSRMYYWLHVVKLERVQQDGARRFGTMYHAGLEEWWKAMDGGDVPWRDKDAALVGALGGIAANAKHVNTDPFEVARAEAMMIAYHARYFELDFTSIDEEKGVELWYNLPLYDGEGKQVPGWRVVGRRDVVKKFGALVKPVEHKTTSMEINGGADYWRGVQINTQATMYIDAACQTGHPTDRLLYDVSRKPGLRPALATPVENRKYTKGKGCKECGGRAGGKLGVAAGTGKIMKTVVDGGRTHDVEATCEACAGTGWTEQPALYQKQRETDETPADFKARIAEEIASDPDAYFRQADTLRTAEAINETRNDLYIATGQIGALLELARVKSGGDPTKNEARLCFPKNTQACTNMYGRVCDFIDVCSGATNPWESQLYQIKKKSKPTTAQAQLPMEQR